MISYYVQADRSYCLVVTPHREYLLTMALKNFEALLPAEWFQRTHRSYLVNLRHIEEVVESELIVGDKRLPLGSNWREALMKRLLN